MGETAVETRREIEQLRSEMAQIIDELERRARSAADARARIASNPVLSGVVAAASAVAIGGGALFVVKAKQRRREEQARIDHRAAELFDLLRERLKPPVRVEVVTGRGDRNHRESRKEPAPRDPGFVKKVLWAALTAGLMALATLLARRLSESLWERAMHEVPPEKVVA